MARVICTYSAAPSIHSASPSPQSPGVPHARCTTNHALNSPHVHMYCCRRCCCCCHAVNAVWRGGGACCDGGGGCKYCCCAICGGASGLAVTA